MANLIVALDHMVGVAALVSAWFWWAASPRGAALPATPAVAAKPAMHPD